MAKRNPGRLPRSASCCCGTLKRWDQRSLRRALESHLQTGTTAPREGLTIAANLALPVARFGWQIAGDILKPTPQSEISKRAKDAFRQFLLVQLADVAKQVAEWEWSVFNASPGLTLHMNADAGRSPTLNFFRQGVEKQTVKLLERYPELARLWVVQVDGWITFAAEFIRRVAEFTKRFPSSALGTVSRLQLGYSDPHAGGRTAVRVTFAKGAEWYYKPRSGYWEHEWFCLLDRINNLGFRTRFEVIPVVDGGGHCWMRSVAWRPCRSLTDAKEFYFRTGALLYLVHQLRGVDFHAGNLIAHGPQPIVVDCEALLHRDVSLPVVARAREKSLCRTGFLPIFSPHEWRQGVSALADLAGGKHCPRFRGRTLSARDFANEVAAGYLGMDQFLRVGRRWNSVFRESHLRREDAKSRLILRPTAHYYSILRSSLSPQRMRDSIGRHRFLAKTCRAGGWPEPACRSEVKALANGDIPLFLAKAARVRLQPSERAIRADTTRLIHTLGDYPPISGHSGGIIRGSYGG